MTNKDLPPRRPYRSVLDYEFETEGALRRALQEVVQSNGSVGGARKGKRDAPSKPRRRPSAASSTDTCNNSTSCHDYEYETKGSFGLVSQEVVQSNVGIGVVPKDKRDAPTKPRRRMSTAGAAAAAASNSTCSLSDSSTEAEDDEDQEYGSFVYDSDEEEDACTFFSEGYDWVTPNTDLTSYRDTYIEQTIEHEHERLQNLASYHILESTTAEKTNKNLDRITRLAGRIFDVPIALVSLVDMGRQWFLSNTGDLQGKATETARNISFCTHTIQTKHDVFVICDATKDARFQNNPLVIGFPYIRFYAGAPLISPEGYKLGSLCIIAPEPRPQGLSPSEIESLKDLADMVVDECVRHRDRCDDTIHTKNNMLNHDSTTNVYSDKLLHQGVTATSSTMPYLASPTFNSSESSSSQLDDRNDRLASSCSLDLLANQFNNSDDDKIEHDRHNYHKSE